MTLLILGVLLWSFAHLFKRLFPGPRAAMEESLGPVPSKIVFVVVLLASVLLMVIGYRDAGPPVRFNGPEILVHINNTLMLGAVALFGISGSKSHARQLFRHPQLYGFITWAVAHLLVNWDFPSVVLFGGLLIWALGEIQIINRQETGVTRYTGGSFKGDLRLAAISIVVYLVIIWLHGLAGVSPLPGRA
jgi:uncharacterized membrane protein